MNASQQITCPKCGIANKNVAIFCQDCGFALKEIKSEPIETSSQENSTKNLPEYEVTERKRIRVYSVIILTIFFAIFFIMLSLIFPEFASYGLGLSVIVICILGYFSFREYFNNLRKTFSISVENIKLQKTIKLIQVRWDEFDFLKVKVLGEFYSSGPFGIHRDNTKFRISCFDGKSNRIIRSFKFQFFNRSKGKEVLDLLIKFAQIKNKELKIKKKHMD